VESDEGSFDLDVFLADVFAILEEGIRKEHHRFPGILKWSHANQSLRVVEELLDNVGTSKHGQMV
jgi:hypothetical protein